MADTKITKKDKLGYILEICKGTEYEQILTEYVESELGVMERRAEKDRERAAAKRLEGDELQKQIKEILNNEYQTLSDIVDAYKANYDIDLAQQKVTPKLTNLIEAGVAVKATVKTDAGTRTAYKLA